LAIQGESAMVRVKDRTSPRRKIAGDPFKWPSAFSAA
jgi:hypothetical protein